jgi:FkbM family methyltransferase
MSLKSFIKKAIVDIIPDSIKRAIRNPYINSNVSYSQEGEDLILERIFGKKAKGFFIDVGAHHPVKYSNTYIFYLKGWRGINIDAMPGSMEVFNELRPDDINIECPISDDEEELTYYIFNEPALNTFSEEEAKKKDGIENFKVTRTEKLRTKKLANVVAEYLPNGQGVDFISIDVEGLDLRVLKSIDWNVIKPKIILVEDLSRDLEIIFEKGEVRKYLQTKGYKIFAKTVNTVFFKFEE